MWSRIDSPLGRLTRRTATVMISVPEASWASRITSIEAYLPVPTISRDVNSLPPSTRFVSYMPLPPAFPAHGSAPFTSHRHVFRLGSRLGAVHLVPPPIGRTISTLSPSDSVTAP